MVLPLISQAGNKSIFERQMLANSVNNNKWSARLRNDVQEYNYRVNEGDINAKKQIIKFNKARLKLKRIDPLQVLSGTGKSTGNITLDLAFDERRCDASQTLKAVVKKILTAVCLAFMVFKPVADYKNVALWVQAFLMVILVITSAWGGYMAGYKSMAINKCEVFNKRECFLKSFLESVGAKTTVETTTPD